MRRFDSDPRLQPFSELSDSPQRRMKSGSSVPRSTRLYSCCRFFSSALAVRVTAAWRLKESQRLWAVTYQQVLGLLVVVEDHFVSFATEA